MSLLAAMKKADNKTVTEKGAGAYTSTLNAVLDLFAKGAVTDLPVKPFKNKNQPALEALFSKALAEDETNAVLCAFYIGAIRGGQGRRQHMKTFLRYLINNGRHETFLKIFKLVPEYSRWDILFDFVHDKKVGRAVTDFIVTSLKTDVEKEHPSLLGKWMPSINASSKATQALGRFFAKELGFGERTYRKTLSALRTKIGIVEKLISSNKWGEVNYSHVTSKAQFNYRKAFRKHDEDRYQAFLDKAVKGEVKINSSVMYPSDLVSPYLSGKVSRTDDTIEAQWKQLPNYVETGKNVNALVLADVSGSMTGKPMEVSIALALYLSERATGLFKDHFLTFTTNSKLQQVQGKTLREKVKNLSSADWAGSTNLMSAFDLILKTAVSNRISEEEMPTHLFIVSDMQFDAACGAGGRITSFESITEKYAKAGYTLPTVVFWNVNAKSNVPVEQDQRGVYLVSGYSPSIFKAAVNTKAATPVDMMLEVLNSETFSKVKEALS